MSGSQYATPSLGQVIRDSVDAALQKANTALPAQVVKVDVTKGTCDVQPCIKRTNVKGEVVTRPIIVNVPIATYRAGDAFVSLPIKVGHYVTLIISQESIENWKEKGGIVDPQDPRRFQLMDAIAYPGGYPNSEPPQGVSADDLIIKNGKSLFILKPDGKYTFEGNGKDLIDLVIKLSEQVSTIADKLSTTTTNTQLGPQPLIEGPAFGMAKGEVDGIKAELEEMKG